MAAATTTPALPTPMQPLVVTACTATTAVGHGRTALAAAPAERRSGLRRNDLGATPLPCWIGRVDGVEDCALPARLAAWDCRNNRLAWLALQQDGVMEGARAAIARHGPARV